eukprot:sb/3476408/
MGSRRETVPLLIPYFPLFKPRISMQLKKPELKKPEVCEPLKEIDIRECPKLLSDILGKNEASTIKNNKRVLQLGYSLVTELQGWLERMFVTEKNDKNIMIVDGWNDVFVPVPINMKV